MLLVELLHDLVDLLALLGEADAHRAAVETRPLVMQIAHLDELLQIVGNVRAEVVAARAQLTSGKFGIADVEQEQRLHAVDVRTPAPIKLILDDVEQATMKALDKRQGLEIGRRKFLRALLWCGGLDRARDIFHVTPLQVNRSADFSPLLESISTEDAQRKA